MTAGTKSDFKIYHPQFTAGYTEVMTQNAMLFNEASRGAIQVSTNVMKGDYAYEAFMASLSNIVTRRDITSVSAVSDIKLSMGENVSVKLNRKIGPLGATLDSFRKAGFSQERYSFFLGQQVAKQVWLDRLNTSLAALYPALNAITAVVKDATSSTLKTTNLVDGLAKFGDASDRIVCWISHSKSAFNLMNDQIANYQMDMVAGYNIITGNLRTFNRPLIMTDSSSLLLTTPDPDEYVTLGLVEGAIVIEESEIPLVITEIVSGLENLVFRTQGEYAYNLSLKGFTWDVGNGGANPDATAIATATNWDKTATDNKDLAGVVIKSL